MTQPTHPIQLRVLDPRMAEFLPAYATPGAAAVDLHVATGRPISLAPGVRKKFPTGLAMWIEHPGYVALVVPRSGLGSQGLMLANTVGVIDSDYQGEIILNLFNAGDTALVIQPLMRVAQMLITPVVHAEWRVVDAFGQATARGEGGFGSTGA